MRFLSICSGIEAASVAWKPLGWEAVAFAEIEPFPSAVLKHHYPEVPNLGDLTKHESWPDLAIDILVGGTPCQGFSIAGLRGGMDDSRSRLSLSYVEIAAQYRPRWLAWENVPGVLTVNGGKDFAAILGALTGREVRVPQEGWRNSGVVEGISAAYGIAWRSFDAQYFGLAQRRKRVFVVGCLGDWRHAAAVLFERASLRWDSPPCRETGKDLAPTISARTKGGGGLGTDFDCDGGLIPHVAGALEAQRGQRNNPAHETWVCSALTGNAYADRASEEANLVTRETYCLDLQNLGDGGNIGVHSAECAAITLNTAGNIGVAQVVAFDTTQITSRENRCNPQSGDACHPLAGQGHAPAIAFQTRIARNGRGQPSEVVPALNGSDAGATSDMRPCIATAAAVRRLTPRECERLQGFPDDYTLIPFRGKTASDGPRYKALGNSFAVPVMAWIGRRIETVDALQ